MTRSMHGETEEKADVTPESGAVLPGCCVKFAKDFSCETVVCPSLTLMKTPERADSRAKDAQSSRSVDGESLCFSVCIPSSPDVPAQFSFTPVLMRLVLRF